MKIEFVDPVGTTDFRDSSGRSHHGACSGANCPTISQRGKFISTASFDGTDDFISVADHADFDLTDWSISLWVRFTDSSLQRLVSQQFGADNYWLMGVDTGKLRCGSSLDSVVGLKGSAFNDGNWHHLVCTRSTTADLVAWYVNGVQVGNEAAASNSAYSLNRDVMIGRFDNSESVGQYFDGEMKEVAVWNTVLLRHQVAYLYQGRKLIEYPSGLTPSNPVELFMLALAYPTFSLFLTSR